MNKIINDKMEIANDLIPQKLCFITLGNFFFLLKKLIIKRKYDITVFSRFTTNKEKKFHRKRKWQFV